MPRRHALAPNQAFKLTRRAACLRRGHAFGEDRGVRKACTSPAVQLDAGVSRMRGSRCRQTHLSCAAEEHSSPLISCRMWCSGPPGRGPCIRPARAQPDPP